MPKNIDVEKAYELVRIVQDALLTSNDIVSRKEHPYYWDHDAIPRPLKEFKKILERYRRISSDLIAELDRSATFKSFLSAAADFNDLSKRSFFHGIVLHLIVSSFGIGDCGECSTRAAIELTNAGYTNLAFVSVKFTAAEQGMETFHQFVVTNLTQAPLLSHGNNIAIEEFFSSLPQEAVVIDAFLGLCFAPRNVPAAFASYLDAYGGKAVVADFRHFYNLSKKSFGGYVSISSQVKTMLESRKILPTLGEFSSPESWRAKTVSILSSEARDYLHRLETVLGYAAGRKIVQVNERAATVSFPSFWLRQLGDEATDELSNELGVSSRTLRSN